MRKRKKTYKNEITELILFGHSVEYWLKYEAGIMQACIEMKLDPVNYLNSRLYISLPEDDNHKKALCFLLKKIKEPMREDEIAATTFLEEAGNGKFNY